MATYHVVNQSQLNEAILKAKGGDSILLASGNYARLALDKDFASSVTIASADKTRPAVVAELQVNGATNVSLEGLKFDHTGRSNEAFSIENSSKISIKGATFDGHVTGEGFGSGHGLKVSRSSDITVEDTKAFNFVNGFTFSNVNGLVVKNNDMSGMAADSMRFAGVVNVRIDGNNYHSQKSPADLAHKDAIQFWTSSTEGPSRNVVITGNTFDNNEKTHTIFMGNALARDDLSKPYVDFLIEKNHIKGGHAHGIAIEHVNGVVIRDNVLEQADGLADIPLLTPIINVGRASVNVTITGNEVPSVPRAINGTWNVSGNTITDTKTYLHWYGHVGSGTYSAAPSATYLDWIQPKNSAPVLIEGGELASVGVNVLDPAGAALRELGIRANDADGGGIRGYAVTGNAANPATQGVWQYSGDAGGTWHAIGQVDDAAALALSAATLIRFVPAAGFVGDPAPLTIRALDATIARLTVSGTSENRVELDTRVNGGSTGISAAEAEISTLIDSVYLGGNANDAFTGSNGVNWTLSGGAGHDRLTGADLADVVRGGTGGDEINGRAGDDLLFGDEGADVILGGAGSDVMRGGAGDDVYFVGQPGDQVIEAAAEGVDHVNSWIDHTLAENVENLVLLGTADVDGSGNASANVVRGNGGDNVLRGAEGVDTLIGGLGKDFLNGGTGADTFVFQNAAESRSGAERDVIEAFRSGVDKINLNGIDADSARAGDQAFKFIGSASLSGTSGELRHYNGVIAGDVNGDGRADFEIEITGLQALRQGDFLL